jgi:hypothetical protein
VTRVHVIHGIHNSFGETFLTGLLDLLKGGGFTVLFPDYGWIWGLETRIANPLIVRSMLPYIQPGDIIVGHSNGCAIGYDLMGLKAPIGGAVFINAALEQRISRRPNVKWIDVYFNAGDQITEAAKLAQEMGIVDSVWGEMGHAGYLGSDPAISNIDCQKTPGMPVVIGHSDIFTPLKMGAWGPFIVKRITAHLSTG